MNSRYSTFLLCLLVTALNACAGFPTSPRADDARARVTPAIERQLAALNAAEDTRIYLRGFKEEKILEVWVEDRSGALVPFKTYRICKFSGNLGPKIKEGDKQAPEGFYDVTVNRLNPYSRHHLSFNIGFPNEYDQSLGRTGSALMIHGGCQSIGCFAMGDEQMEEIYIIVERALRHGQGSIPVDLFPFRMTSENLNRHAKSPHMSFWMALKPGYDAFEMRQNPALLTAKLDII